MDIYLDANATTPVLPQARAAALAAMTDGYGNPSSIHGTGLRARVTMDEARARARRVLGAPDGQLLFLSGATEGIQTAVLSALCALRERRARGADAARLLLYGATEHKAVPQALAHWNAMLGLDLEIAAIPVDTDGRHDLAWLRARAPEAGLVCTMAANNETGVISDLDGIEAALAGSPALWLVDGVQALGKLDLALGRRRIDYAPFSGHKLYAPKGIGLLYVRAGAPLTPLLAGGGQEGAMRSGTENMPGIAALGAVLQALEEGDSFQDADTLVDYRRRLGEALADAFPGVVFNAPESLSLPTTLNFSVPGIGSRLLLDLFDAADIRVSGGSACGAAKAQPSYVLEAMGLAAWRAASAVRLSFGSATPPALIDEACARIRACGASLRQSCLTVPPTRHDGTPDVVTRHVVDGACCYLVTDADARQCVVIDPLPASTAPLAQWIACRGYTLRAVLDTRGDRGPSAAELRALLPAGQAGPDEVDLLGWPLGGSALRCGALRLSRLALPADTTEATAVLLHDARGLRLAFVGDALRPAEPGHTDPASDHAADAADGAPGRAPGRTDLAGSESLPRDAALRRLAAHVGDDTPLLPANDLDDRHACTLATERGAVAAPASGDLALLPSAIEALAAAGTPVLLIDVRESYEQRVGTVPALAGVAAPRAVPLSALAGTVGDWLALPADTVPVFVCRSGNRSAQAARALRRLGRANARSLAGGLALWPAAAAEVDVPEQASGVTGAGNWPQDDVQASPTATRDATRSAAGG